MERSSRDLLGVFRDTLFRLFRLAQVGPPVFFQHSRIVFEHFWKKWVWGLGGSWGTDQIRSQGGWGGPPGGV